MSQANVVALHPLDEAEAFAWISGQLDRSTETSVSDLARQFGWPPTRLRRRLAMWAAAGQITQQPTRRGKFIIGVPTAEHSAEEPAMVAAAPAGPAELPEPPMSQAATREAATRLIERAFSQVTAPTPLPRRSWIATGTGGVLLATALSMTMVGLVMNARFAASFGQSVEASALLALIGLAIDILAVVLPTVAAQLWQNRSHSTALVSWVIWVVALMMTLLAATGFASTNIGDAVAGRAKIQAESAALVERIDQLKTERGAITDTRPIAAIETELQRAQPGAARVWRITDGCRDVTRVVSGQLCAPVLELRQAIASAERRDALDVELRATEARLAALPPILSPDPQAKTAAEMITWVSLGTLRPDTQDIFWLRTIGLALMPSLGGLIAMLALQLMRARPSWSERGLV